LHRARISARTPWQRVLNVAAGDVIDITASGKWRSSPDIVAGPEGGLSPGGDKWGKFRDRFYLQGKFGGKVFKIGSKFTLQAERSGAFELGMNEADPEWFKNNSGFLGVTLSVRKRPVVIKSSPDIDSPSTLVTTAHR
jgi:hypothetical protein